MEDWLQCQIRALVKCRENQNQSLWDTSYKQLIERITTSEITIETMDSV